MMNIIRADMYRIVRGKAIYITLIILTIMSVLISTGSGTVGIASGLLMDYETSGEPTGGLAAVTNALSELDTLIYFLIPMFMTVCVTMFSHATVKNELSAGVPRVKLYFAKLMLSAVLCFILTLFHPFVVWLSGSIMHGFGGPYTPEYIGGLFKIIGAQFVLLLAFTSIGVFFSFTTKRAAAVNGAYIAFALVPLLVISILSMRYERVLELVKYDLTGCMKAFAFIDQLPKEDITRGLLTGVAYILITTIAGVTLFKRAEIK